MKLIIFILIVCLVNSVSANTELTADELDQWFESDSFEAPVLSPQVNDGNLVFLHEPIEKPALQLINRFIIDRSSLDSGWLKVSQCYENLDAMSESEIIYKNRHMRELKIDFHENIETAYVSGLSVQLKNVTRPAKICVSAEVKNLHKTGHNNYVLVNGPYHRRFLDGYFPFKLTMDILLPGNLTFKSSKPVRQRGFDVELSDSRVIINTLFEGVLNTEITFEKSDD